MNRIPYLLPLALAAAIQPIGAQRLPAFELSIPSIMRGPEVYGREPQRVRWSADNR